MGTFVDSLDEVADSAPLPTTVPFVVEVGDGHCSDPLVARPSYMEGYYLFSVSAVLVEQVVRFLDAVDVVGFAVDGDAAVVDHGLAHPVEGVLPVFDRDLIVFHRRLRVLMT